MRTKTSKAASQRQVTVAASAVGPQTRLSLDEWAQLRKAAQELERPTTYIVRLAIREWLMRFHERFGGGSDGNQGAEHGHQGRG